jgi:peptide/nickel transport system substrate-binding protein
MPSRLQRNTRAAPLAVALALAGCSQRTRRTPDDTLVVLMEAAATTTDPRYALSNYDSKVWHLVAAGLTTVDTADMQPVLLLAEKIEWIDDHTVDATLRPGLVFSDGNPVTAADVAWTFGSVLPDDSAAATHKQLSERFSSVEALDARRTRFHLKAPLATLMSDLDFGIVEKAAAGKNGRFADNLVIGAGPYVIDDLGPRGAHLHANPRWSGPAPKVGQLEIRVVGDASARILMLVGGSADLVQNGVRLDLVDDLADQWRVHVTTAPSSLLTYLMMNNQDPVLADVRVRQAIALALDREAIIRAKLGGHAVLATGLLPPNHWAYAGDVTHWRHDPARAKQLLDAAHYVDPDGDGPAPRRGPDGAPLVLTYKTSSDQYRIAIAHVIAAQLREVGIEVEVMPFEFGTFFSQIKKGVYQLASMQTSDITEPDYYFTYFNSTRIPGPGHVDDNNRWRYANARVDALTVLGRRQLELAERKRTYAEVQRIIAAEVPIIPLWHEDNVVVENRTVDGYTMFPDARYAGLVTTAKSPLP